MFMVQDKAGAIVSISFSLLFLGSWPTILTHAERKGRLPQHAYLDYSVSNLLAAVLIALTFGQLGDGRPNFFTQLRQAQDDWPSVLFALGGGAALSVGNLCTQYGWAYVGLSLTEVIVSSLTVVVGTTLNYFLDNKINSAAILFPGVACFLAAATLACALHSSNKADDKKKLSASPNSYSFCTNGGLTLGEQVSITEPLRDTENGDSPVTDATRAKPGSKEYLIELEQRRSIKVLESNKFIGIAIVLFAGFLMSLFSPAFNLATNDQWHTLKDGVPHLMVYTAYFYFSISSFVIGVGINIWFLYCPIADVEKSSFKAYLKDWKGRQWALLAGLLCGFGNGLEFMGGQAAGYAAADAVEALPLVSTFWAILLLKEYWRASKKTYILLVSMLFTFAAAVALLMGSAGQRSTK
ncbi:ureide permease 1 [Brachypodium distachyon]|uniref:Uncharacterized protein n=1 Tax=Brachypodium distachyon TaxID=15368 RepID=I1II72_BRADI|nr:ureide permease 1 [Brachypodium distachyon]KQJ86633.1 hypothetical protein BRADI_4g06757v3 [Brachypodium distachyon]|eukprot:XP_003576090.1 ureide permease 1 [Brachypodium distachyon]